MKKKIGVAITGSGLVVSTEKWTKALKSVREKVAVEDDGTLLCTFLKYSYILFLTSNHPNFWLK